MSVEQNQLLVSNRNAETKEKDLEVYGNDIFCPN